MNRWEFKLLDSEDRPIGTLDGVNAENGGSAEIVAQSPLGGSASLILDNRQDIDWMSDRVQAVFHTGAVSWPVGTFLFSSPTEDHDDDLDMITYDVGLLTKMNIPHEDSVDDWYSVPAGTPVIARVVSLLESTGETRIAVTASDLTLDAPLVFEPGESKLTIINALLQAAGYWSLWCDGSGMFRVEPYVNPADRPIAYSFQHGETSVHFPRWSRQQDHTSVPNKFIAVGQGDEDVTALRGIAVNNDPSSPYSGQRRGTPENPRWITASEDGVEALTQQIIDDYAARRLRDVMDPVARLKVDHAMLDLPPNALVEFIPRDGVTKLATVQKMKIDFTFDTDIRAEWREVLS